MIVIGNMIPKIITTSLAEVLVIFFVILIRKPIFLTMLLYKLSASLYPIRRKYVMLFIDSK